MIFFIISLVAGFLTVLTPCVLPILPIVLGSSVSNTGVNRKKSIVVISSLIISVFIFTFILRVSTAFISVPERFWTYLSGAIILIFGLSLIFPTLWSKISASAFSRSNELLNKSYGNRNKWWGDIALGASLGPIFTTCSPTFFVIIATVIPASLATGVFYLLAYCLGLAFSLFLIALLGQKILIRFSSLSDSTGNFKKILGIIFILLAILIATGVIKKIETRILEAGFLDFTKIEMSIANFLQKDNSGDIKKEQVDDPIGIEDKNLNKIPESEQNVPKDVEKQNDYNSFPYKEIVSPAGFVNSDEFKLSGIVGKKVILLDFMTYSCINCQRTFPYLNAWYSEYKDQGLEIVAIHTPEFAFEKNIDNVRKAAKEFGLEFPLVLDNDYGTWNVYSNRYWPRKYLIDIEGNIVYDHIGEGEYDKTEQKIVELLKERADKLGGEVGSSSVKVDPYSIYSRSPETYFGAWRNNNFGNGLPFVEQSDTFVIPELIASNIFYLGGDWQILKEFAETVGSETELIFKFDSKEVYLVAETINKQLLGNVSIYMDGNILPDIFAGKDVSKGKAEIKDSRLYHLISLPVAGEHTLRIIFQNPNTRIYTFTFG